MSTVSYKKICTIKITHDYFSNSIDGNIQIFPGLITQQLLNRFDIQIQNTQGSCNIYINSESSTEEFLSYLESVTSNNFFDLNMQVASPNFYSYTDIPMDSNASYLYESNASENSIDTNVVLLSPKANTAILNTTFAEVKIYFQDIIENPSEEHMFLIALKARATFWQYFIINNSQINLSNPFIKGDNEMGFHEQKQVTIKNGQEALEFTTKQPIKLSASPKYQFDLCDRISKNGQTRTKKIFAGLPNPDPTNLSVIINDGNQKVLSPMYIYV